MNLIEKNKNIIIKLIKNSLSKSDDYSSFKEEKIILEIPKNKLHGDFACNIAMVLSKKAQINPEKIAKNIVLNLEENELIQKVEIKAPGFINFFLKNDWIKEALELIERGDYGKSDIGKNKKVNIEFVSANPTGPMHLGNARGGALGDSLASIFEFSGYKATREFYINDSGNQIKNFTDSIEYHYIEIAGGKNEKEFPENGYVGSDVASLAKDFFDENGDKFIDADSKVRRENLIRFAIEKNVLNLKKTLEKYKIYYDMWFKESSLYENNEVQNVIKYLVNNDFTYEKDGAIWIKCTKTGAEKDEVLVRKNGIPTYLAPDIAYHKNKLKTRGYDLAVNVLGADHHGYAPKLKSSIEMLGINSGKLKIVIMQLVRLVRNGETIRMSKRTGKTITLDDLLEEICVDSIRFFFITRSPGSHMEFDMDLAKAQDNNNPVYYVKYAHARICSILKMLENKGIVVPKASDVSPTKLVLDEEIALLKKLCEFPEVIKLSLEMLDPSRVTKYVLEVSTLFHTFYNNCRVQNNDLELEKARIKLIVSTKIIIKTILDLLKIDAPEKM